MMPIDNQPHNSGSNCPKLTIVIPVHNRAQLVRATLNCISRQTLRPLRVVLVDNNSTDDTLSVLQEWKSEQEGTGIEVTIVQEQRPGAAAARNRGLQEVTTPYTMFFDSDDLMAPDHCQRAVEGFEKNPDAEIVGWDVVYAFPHKRMLRHFSDKNCHWCNIQFGSMATQRYAARTELFRKVGGWNPDCLGWDDTELGSRLLLATDKVVKLHGAPTVEVVHTADSITGTSFTSGTGKWETALDMIERNYASHLGNPSSISAQSSSATKALPRLIRMLNLRRSILAGDYRHEHSGELAKGLLSATLAKEPSLPYRFFYRLAYHWRAAGMPGAARLLRPLF